MKGAKIKKTEYFPQITQIITELCENLCNLWETIHIFINLGKWSDKRFEKAKD